MKLLQGLRVVEGTAFVAAGLKAGEGRVLNGDQISATRHYLIAELILFILIPLAAVLMARGVGIQTTHP